MEMIFTLTLRTLKENKKRTILTLLTVILSVGMMTAVLCGSWSLLRFLQEKEKAYAGDYVYSIEVSSQEQAAKLLEYENVEDVSLLHFTGSSFLGEMSNKSLLAVAEINDAFIENFSLEQYLLEGRFPSNENEIVLTQEFLTDNDLTFSVGDTIQLSLGKRIWDEIDTELYGRVNYLGERESFQVDTEKTYTLVGIVSEMKNSKVASNFNAYSGVDNHGSDLTAYVTCTNITKSVYTEAEENARSVNGQVSQFHDDLLMYYGITQGNGALKMAAIVTAIVLLLMIACGAMISNVLSISLQERIKQLGILVSVGATKKQKRASVAIEAFLLGMIGIPFGVLFGLCLTVLVLLLMKHSFTTMFSFGMIELHLKCHWVIIVLDFIAGVFSLVLACKKPGKIASSVHVIDTLKQTNVYQITKKKSLHGKIMAVFFGIYGDLAGKNIYRNPKRFRAITVSIFLAVVLGLSLYSFSDFMLLQASANMKEDGSSYTDVFVSVPHKDLQNALRCIYNESTTADISYRICRYMSTDVNDAMINADMKGYFINDTLAEFYVVGMDEEHFRILCEENSLDYSAYEENSNCGILFNSAIGNYDSFSNRVIIGSPLVLENGTQLSLQIDGEKGEVKNVIVWDVIDHSNAYVKSQFVGNIPVLVFPISFFDWLIEDDTYMELAISTKQHEEVTKCLADEGFFQAYDVANATESSRQTFTLLKITVCIFAVLMTLIVGLNVCNTILNTIQMRKTEFAVLRSVGMTSGGLKKMLLLEAALYGIKSLVFALPISFVIHCAIYHILSAEEPFLFYINWSSYVIAALTVAIIVVFAMLFSVHNISKMEIVKELKK